jgi:ubiquinone biosynthesis monooxygenase Coq7
MNIDTLIISLDRALRVVSGASKAQRNSPGDAVPEHVLGDRDRGRSAGLMRVNHVGEVCAQALYSAQAQFARSDQLRQQFVLAGKEEADHLAWTAQRLQELGSHASLLNPVWYAGAFLLGAVAARVGENQSLGFVVETERQVEAHLESHLESLPESDAKSLAIVRQMRDDEARHGADAQAMGAAKMPKPLQFAMTGVAKVMTTTAYYI